MTDTLFGPAVDPAARQGDKTAMEGPLRPSWSTLTNVVLPPCDRHLLRLHETWRDGKTPFVPVPKARVKRVHAGSEELLCRECEGDQKEQDRREFPVKPPRFKRKAA